MDAYHDAVAQPCRAKDHFRSESIEALASALLDDSQVACLEENSPHSPDYNVAAVRYYRNPPANDLDTQEGLVLSRPLSSQAEHSFNSKVRWDVLGTRNPHKAKGTLARAATTQTRSDSSRTQHEPAMARPLSQSTALNSHKPGMKALVPVPLSSVGSAPPVIQKEKPGANPEPTAVDEINQKVCAMLAATDALKPSSAQAISSSKTSRISPSKVFSKMSDAWGRFHIKHSDPHSNSGKKMDTLPVLDEIDPLTFSDIAFDTPAVTGNHSISTIEIRLNEGDNLNKRKVQKIVGGHVVRKPVAEDGKSLRSGKSIDDPFSDRGRSHTRTTLDSRLTLITNEADDIPPVPRNPFESEKEFENDLEDRILSSMPLGSSTPRVRIYKFSSSTSSGSLTGKRPRSANEHVD